MKAIIFSICCLLIPATLSFRPGGDGTTRKIDDTMRGNSVAIPPKNKKDVGVMCKLGMCGVSKDTMFLYLANKLDRGMIEMMMSKQTEVDAEMVDALLKINATDVKMIVTMMIKDIMDVQMMKTMLANFLGMRASSMNERAMRKLLSRFAGVNMMTLQDVEMLKVAMAKLMMYLEMARLMDKNDDKKIVREIINAGASPEIGINLRTRPEWLNLEVMSKMMAGLSSKKDGAE